MNINENLCSDIMFFFVLNDFVYIIMFYFSKKTNFQKNLVKKNLNKPEYF